MLVNCEYCRTFTMNIYPFFYPKHNNDYYIINLIFLRQAGYCHHRRLYVSLFVFSLFIFLCVFVVCLFVDRLCLFLYLCLFVISLFVFISLIFFWFLCFLFICLWILCLWFLCFLFLCLWRTKKQCYTNPHQTLPQCLSILGQKQSNFWVSMGQRSRVIYIYIYILYSYINI